MEDARFLSALSGRIDEALAIADRSCDVRDEEVALVKIVALVNAHPEHRQVAERPMLELLHELEQTPARLGIVELLAYCVHVVSFSLLVEVARARRDSALAECEKGGSGRRWEHARAMQRVIDAEDPGWEDSDMFVTLSSKQPVD